MTSLSLMLGSFRLWASLPPFILYYLFYSTFERLNPEGPVYDTKVITMSVTHSFLPFHRRCSINVCAHTPRVHSYIRALLTFWSSLSGFGSSQRANGELLWTWMPFPLVIPSAANSVRNGLLYRCSVWWNPVNWCRRTWQPGRGQ